ncbi:MAG: hypothetical protein KAI85_03415 [Halopseudomonas aestusnigri]|nr:hypothetical protein [Halopseudomonas aestusnigri]
MKDKCTVEVMANRAELAVQLLREVLDQHGTLGDLAEVTMPSTREDLLYLQQAILTGSTIDNYPDESSVLDVVSALPSGQIWATYIRV